MVDDDADILLAAKLILKKHFDRILIADGQESAELLLSENKVDIALLDMNYSAGATSGKEGFELLRKIKILSPSTRVVMMTAYGDIDLAIKAIKEGATDFIVKPWDNAKLISTVLGAFQKGYSQEHPETVVPEADARNIRQSLAEVERIFMFLDIRSSTSIAEALGHLRYFELLHDFFRDIATPISINKGQIYQYVGDEVVLSWDLQSGLDNGKCLRCFFDIADEIEKLAPRYKEKYDIVPAFKAGMHYGKVSTGLVGTLKKEIIYTGDVLNTASRIEGMCNTHNVDLLISESLIDKLPPTDSYTPKRIGEINLRGKRSEIILYTVERVVTNTVDT